jgi:hypothetical protein
MTETIKALHAKQGGSNDAPQATNITPRRTVSRWWILGLLSAGLIGGVTSRAEADPAGMPIANEIFYNCTFDIGLLNDALTVDQANLDLLASGQIEASYIIIYVRQNANDGQQLAGTTPTFTGPVLCTNGATDDISKVNEGDGIAGPVNVLGAEEVSHLQVRSTSSSADNDKKKRVCHTVASSTECFLIEKPLD